MPKSILVKPIRNLFSRENRAGAPVRAGALHAL